MLHVEPSVTPLRSLSWRKGGAHDSPPQSRIDPYQVLRNDPGHWDRQIAADLAAEIKAIAGDRSSDIPEIRRFLAVKGYRDLKAHLLEAVDTKTGASALEAAIYAMRSFAHMRPGISAATFRTTAL